MSVVFRYLFPSGLAQIQQLWVNKELVKRDSHCARPCIRAGLRHTHWTLILQALSSCLGCPSVLKWSRSVVSDSLQPHGLWPARLLCPWGFPGKNTGVDCHFLVHIYAKVFAKGKEGFSPKSQISRTQSLLQVNTKHDSMYFFRVCSDVIVPFPKAKIIQVRERELC